MKFTSTLLAASLLTGLVSASPKAVPAASPLKHGSSYALTMGPVTFLYPETRQWSEDVDNIAPCGSNAGVQNRSDFPLDDGFVAFIAKYNSYKVRLSISYNENPTSQDDFDVWYDGSNVTDELHIGHTCFYMPDQPNSINAGDVATIQVIYQNDDEDGESYESGAEVEGATNETYYACSDITFVEESVFDVTDYALSCFNATDDNYYSESDVDTATSAATYDSSVVSKVSSVASSVAKTASDSQSSASSTSSSSSSSSAGAAVVAAVLSSPVAGFAGVLALIAGLL